MYKRIETQVGSVPFGERSSTQQLLASEFTSDGALTAGHVHQHAISFAGRKLLLFVVAAAVNAEIISITNATELL
ncbi:hypothetical protein SLE2022_008220 [Rubroshorea leprosula]